MGFALGGSLFWGLYGPNTTIEHVSTSYEQDSTQYETPTEKEKADEALARYTFWLTLFTGILALATIGLGIATVGLYLTGEKQAKIAKLAGLRQFRQTRESIALTRQAAEAAEHSNILTRDLFLAEQRPWLRCTLNTLAYMEKMDDGKLYITVTGELKNVGKAPAIGIVYFGKLYPNPPIPPGNAAMRYYEEHLASGGFPMASLLPDDAPFQLSFTPHGENADFPASGAHSNFWLAFHAFYRLGGSENVGRIGAAYMIVRAGTETKSIENGKERHRVSVHLKEFETVRLIT